MKRRISALLLMGACAFIGYELLSTKTSPTGVVDNLIIPSRIPVSSGGSLKAESLPGPSAPADVGSFSVQQARAYAALGEVADGRREQLPAFDIETRTVVEAMRRLLALQPLSAGKGKPTTGQSGVVSRVEFGAANSATTNIADDKTSLGKPHTEVVPLALADGKRHLNVGRRTGAVQLEAGEQVIFGRDVWAAIKAKPGQGLPVRITDRGEGGHVIAVFGEDFGTVRVNGGLVVPGRYYLIKGSVEITGMAPIGVHIRPLSAVPSYHEQPLMVPSASG